MRRAAVVVFALLGAACSRMSGTTPVPMPSKDDGGTSAADGGSSVIEPSETGAQIYDRRCASCHGLFAEGLPPNPALDRWTRGKPEMVLAISTRMPPTAPGSCGADCAGKVADHILERLQRTTTPTSAAPCEAPAKWPRQLRLLSAEEYAATVRDLFSAEGVSCQDDGECSVSSQSCTNHQCTADPCTRRTFLYAPSGGQPRSVVLAGSFNNWAGTVAMGAWPLTPLGNRWVLKRELPAGRYEYKFVVDGTQWIADPGNPNRVNDGFGGQNSVLEFSCGTGGAGNDLDLAELVRRFPPENRPRGFGFDDHAIARVMSPRLMDAQIEAAKLIAGHYAGRSEWLACNRAQTSDCATAFARDFGRRAFRRPLTAAEQARLVQLVSSGAAQSGLTHGLELGLRAVLSSPSFLYRSEIGAPGSGGAIELSEHELASALSYFFWGTMPDERLLGAADRGELKALARRQAEAARLLADPRAAAGLKRFAAGWLGIDRILTADKRADLFPELDAALRRDLYEESRELFAHVVLSGSGKLEEVYTADYSFLNDRLAALYGVASGPSGHERVRTAYGAIGRRGVLSHGSVLGAYAYSDQSSPVRRGVFVREHLLCQTLPTPPPNAGGIPEVDPRATTRERFRQHSDSPACRGCHALIDPVGFGFERFDALGRARSSENGQPIDSSGDLTDVERLGAGTHATFDSVSELAPLLAASPNAKGCFARQMWRFAKGSEESSADRCGVQAVAKGFVESGGDIRQLMIAIATSDAFLERE